MGIRFWLARGWDVILEEREGAPSSELVDMDSAPTARPMEMEPEIIWEAICWIERRPEEQKRLQTEAAAVTG
jgi:hypothetical protein